MPTPSVIDAFVSATQFLSDTIQGVAGDARTSLAQAEAYADDPAAYDPETQSWAGDGGMRYRVPLLDLPSELHTMTKKRNIRILLDNVRHICVNDELPSTPEEKKFWSGYRFLKYQLYFKPFAIALPPIYLGLRSMQARLPRSLRGKVFPIMLTSVVAEQWMDAMYPTHDLLTRAMRAKTPLGDAARAEWQRLSQVHIPAFTFATYQGSLLVDPNKEFQFGGNLSVALGGQ